MPHIRHALPLLLVASAAHAVEVDGSLRLWLGGGLDTNPRRDFVVTGDRTPTDAVLQGLLQLDGSLRGERGGLLASYDLGGRKFILLPSEDTLVQNASLDAEVVLLREVSLGSTLHLRDRRGADRNYTDLSGSAWIRFMVQSRLDARASIGAHRFIFWPRFPYSFWAPEIGVQARFRITKRHSVSAFLEFEPRTYNANAAPRPELDPPPELGVRRDTFFIVGVGYQYRGPWAFGFNYSFMESDSNSYGETLRRHRINANAGVKLFWELSVMANVVLQLAQYPDGVYLSDELIVIDDDESQNQVALKLARPLGDHFEIDFRWQLFFNKLVKNDLTYLRNTFTLGVSFKLDSYD